MLGAPQPSSAIRCWSHPYSRNVAEGVFSEVYILHRSGPRLMSIGDSGRLSSGHYHDFLDLPIKPSGCATAWLR